MARKAGSDDQTVQQAVEAILADAMPDSGADARAASAAGVPVDAVALAPTEPVQTATPAGPDVAAPWGEARPGAAAPAVPQDTAPAPGPVLIDPPPTSRAAAPAATPAAPQGPARMEPPTPPQITVQKVSALPLLLAGALTAALAFAVAWVARDTFWPDLSAGLAAQADRIAALEQAAPPAMPDLGPLESRIATLESQLGAEAAALRAEIAAMPAADAVLEEVAAALATLDTRLTALERAPAADGTLPQAAIDAWQADLDALRAGLADQAGRLDVLANQPASPDTAAFEARLQELTAAAEAELAAARAQATAVGSDAAATAAAASERAAMDRVLAALDAGTPYDLALADLAAAGATLPQALTTPAADGLATLAALQADFPQAARAALTVARAEGLADAEGSRFWAFLRAQFDVRSVTPRDGADPDAILSRAEAALADGRLTDALGEVASLPEVVRAAMADWTGRAEARTAALAAAAVLSDTLARN